MYINITNMIIEKFKYDNGFTCEDKPFKDERDIITIFMK